MVEKENKDGRPRRADLQVEGAMREGSGQIDTENSYRGARSTTTRICIASTQKAWMQIPPQVRVQLSPHLDFGL